MTHFLFAGDSVTDSGRTFFDPEVGAGYLGDGWVRMVAGDLGRREPERHVVFNAGVAGDRVQDLLARWDNDVVRHQPDDLTILIGINDACRYPWTAPEAVEHAFAALLRSIPSGVERLVVVEPFVLVVDDNTAKIRARHLSNLEAMRRAVSAVDEEVLVLPLDDLMQEATKRAAPTWWAEDGIHPTVAGHALIADAWLGLLGHRA